MQSPCGKPPARLIPRPMYRGTFGSYDTLGMRQASQPVAECREPKKLHGICRPSCSLAQMLWASSAPVLGKWIGITIIPE